ncbi:hypothetical protein A2U01_0091242, partial [Trifolium medium]|nr:hypothetical protein [Trifolium medium]
MAQRAVSFLFSGFAYGPCATREDVWRNARGCLAQRALGVRVVLFCSGGCATR